MMTNMPPEILGMGPTQHVATGVCVYRYSVRLNGSLCLQIFRPLTRESVFTYIPSAYIRRHRCLVFQVPDCRGAVVGSVAGLGPSRPPSASSPFPGHAAANVDMLHMGLEPRLGTRPATYGRGLGRGP